MSYKSDASTIQALEEFILDTKPFHSKLFDLSVEYEFDDTLSARFSNEVANKNIHLSSVWKGDNNSAYTPWSMAYTADGSSLKYKKQLLPATAFPRFRQLKNSTNSSASYTYLGVHDESIESIPSTGMDIKVLGYELLTTDQVYVNTEGRFDELPYDQGPYDDATSILVNKFRYVVNFQATIYYKMPLDATLLSVGLANQIFSSYDTSVPGQVQITLNANVSYNEFNTIFNYQTVLSKSGDPVFLTNLLRYMVSVTYAAASIQIRRSGQYPTPFHHGSLVTVNGTTMTLGQNYMVDSQSRDRLVFLPGFIPDVNDLINITLMYSDRLFVSFNGVWQDYQIIQHSHSYATLGPNSTFTNWDGGQDPSDRLMFCYFSDEYQGFYNRFIAGDLDVAELDVTTLNESVYQFQEINFTNVAWTRTGTVLTVNVPSHDLGVGDALAVNSNSLGLINANLSVTSVIDQSNFTLTVIDGGPISGSDLAFVYAGGLREDNTTIYNYANDNFLGRVSRSWDINGMLYYSWEFASNPPQGTQVEIRVEAHDQYNEWSQMKFRESLNVQERIKLRDIVTVSMTDQPFVNGLDMETLDEDLFDSPNAITTTALVSKLFFTISRAADSNIGNGNLSVSWNSQQAEFDTFKIVFTSTTAFNIVNIQSSVVIGTGIVGSVFSLPFGLTAKATQGTTTFAANDTIYVYRYAAYDLLPATTVFSQVEKVDRLALKFKSGSTVPKKVTFVDQSTGLVVVPTYELLDTQQVIAYFPYSMSVNATISYS